MAEPYYASTPLATGAVTFLLTDIEGSTALWEQDGARMSQALAAHDLLTRSAVAEQPRECGRRAGRLSSCPGAV